MSKSGTTTPSVRATRHSSGSGGEKFVRSRDPQGLRDVRRRQWSGGILNPAVDDDDAVGEDEVTVAPLASVQEFK
jgi:hypothetical protein